MKKNRIVTERNLPLVNILSSYFNICSKLFLLLLITFFASCDEGANLHNENESSIDMPLIFSDKIELNNSSLEDKFAYRDFHLSNLIEQLVSINPDVVLTDSKSGKQLESAFYLENLLVSKMAKEKGANSKTGKLTSLEAFTDLDGQNWYPTLKMERAGDGKLNNAIYLFSIFDENTQEDIVKAFKMNNGELKLLSDNYTEKMFNQFSSKESSAVFSVALTSCAPNETIADQELISVDCGDPYSGGSGGVGGSGSNTVRQDGVFGYMKIKKKKESWLEKADINYHTWSFETAYPGTSTGVCDEFSDSCDSSGNEIGKWSNSDVNNQKTKIINEKFYDDLNNISRKGTVVAYVIFEADNWPATLRSYTAIVNDATIKFRYRSYDGPYHQNLITLNPANPYNLPFALGTTINNSEIEFNITR